ncbi:hypothetical protein KC878_00980 [Candidatus Saccharibacteria bacterium]|nr:hypothetical protein [Candidatus Saccharibacteria bacterium]MCB9821179.1 hypothetical protein [Candidatus Nomurabacteria bacterium]
MTGQQKDIQNALNRAISRFSYTTNTGEVFWAPYLRNDLYIETKQAIRGLGKTSPDEIKRSVDYIKANYPDLNGQQIRQKLIDGSLPDKSMNYKAIECSGFVYYVMSEVLEVVHGVRLSDMLAMPKEAVMNGALNYKEWQEKHKLTPEEIKNLPNDVPISWVVDNFNRKPANLCNVRTLTSDFSSYAVSPEDAQIGDLVHMLDGADKRQHIAVIVNTENNSIELAHSSRKNPQYLGGVVRETLPITRAGIDCTKLSNPHQFVAIRRLRTTI